MDYHTDEGSWALGCVVLTLFAILCIYLSAPARSQEISKHPCAPTPKIVKMLKSKYGETATIGGVTDDGEPMVIYTNPETGSFSVTVRTQGGMSCLVTSGEGLALADPAKMKGPGL